MRTPIPDFAPSRLAAGIAFATLFVTVAPAASAQQSSYALDEIVVTARKREESLQSTPLAVSALTADQLDSSYAQAAKDLEGMSPNLIYDRVQATPGGAAISIRGVSFQDVEKSFDPAVGVVVDGIYLGTNTGAMLQVFDMERIEVLRGPQGTLFGKNTIGGTINVIRSKPNGELSGKLRARGGSNNRQEIEGVVMFPIIEDKLAGKLTYADRSEDGWYTNSYTGGTAGDFDFREYGGALRFTPNDAVTVDYSYYNLKDQSAAAGLLNQNGATDLFCLPLDIITGDPYIPPGQCAQGGGKPLTGDFYTVAQNFPDDAYIETDAHTFSVNWKLGEAWMLDYLLGYRKSEESMNQDFDAAPVDQFSTIRVQDYEQTSHELRLSYDADGRVRMVAGAYLWESEYQLGQRTFYLFDILSGVTPALAGLAPGRPITQLQATDHSNDSWALFTEMDFDLSEQWTVTLGARYTEEEKEMSRAVALNLGGFPASLVGPVLPSPPFATSFETGSGVYPRATGAILPFFSTFGNPPDQDWSQFSPKVGLRWTPSEDQMLYLNYSNGFRSGGFNGRANALPSALTNFDEETVDTIELGWKATWLDGRVQSNVAVFSSSYDDKQEEIVTPLPGGDQETLTQNASQAQIDGLEIELLARLTEAWSVRANLGYLDASYDDFCADVNGPDAVPPAGSLPGECGSRETTASGTIIPIDNSDLKLRRAPKWNYSVDSSYTWHVGEGDLTLQASYRWKDDYYTTFQNAPLGHTDAFGLLDASVSYTNENWRFAFFGRNLTDERYVASALLVGGLFNFQAIGQDRAYGAEVSYRFGGK